MCLKTSGYIQEYHNHRAQTNAWYSQIPIYFKLQCIVLAIRSLTNQESETIKWENQILSLSLFPSLSLSLSECVRECMCLNNSVLFLQNWKMDVQSQIANLADNLVGISLTQICFFLSKLNISCQFVDQ